MSPHDISSRQMWDPTAIMIDVICFGQKTPFTIVLCVVRDRLLGVVGSTIRWSTWSLMCEVQFFLENPPTKVAKGIRTQTRSKGWLCGTSADHHALYISVKMNGTCMYLFLWNICTTVWFPEQPIWRTAGNPSPCPEIQGIWILNFEFLANQNAWIFSLFYRDCSPKMSRIFPTVRSWDLESFETYMASFRTCTMM